VSPRKRQIEVGFEELLRQRGRPAWLPDDEVLSTDELAALVAGGWDLDTARHFATERRWLAAVHDCANQTREPLPALTARLGFDPVLVEGVDLVRTGAELDVERGRVTLR
jgi:hypothetical protein